MFTNKTWQTSSDSTSVISVLVQHGIWRHGGYIGMRLNLLLGMLLCSPRRDIPDDFRLSRFSNAFTQNTRPMARGCSSSVIRFVLETERQKSSKYRMCGHLAMYRASERQSARILVKFRRDCNWCWLSIIPLIGCGEWYDWYWAGGGPEGGGGMNVGSGFVDGLESINGLKWEPFDPDTCFWCWCRCWYLGADRFLDELLGLVAQERCILTGCGR